MVYLLGFVVLVFGGFYVYQKNPDFFWGIFVHSQELVEDLPSEEELTSKMEEIGAEVETLKNKLVMAKQNGEEKLEEIQVKIAEAEKAFRDTKQALEDLQQAGEDLRGVLD